MRTPPRNHATTADTTAAVDVLMANLDHPLKAEIEIARRALLSVDAEIAEGVKWNAPSFRTGDYFATTNLRATDQVQFVFHLGAKVRTDVPRLVINDPENLVKWLAKDRCLVSLGCGEPFKGKLPAFIDFVRKWIRYV